MKTNKVFELIGRAVIYMTIYFSFIGMLVYGLIHCTVL